MEPRLAVSLQRLRDELGHHWPQLVTWYAAPKSYRGQSDHVPWLSNNAGEPVYRALDVAIGFAGNSYGLLIADQLAFLGAGGHPALTSGAYLLSNRRIACPETRWRWHDYLGSPYLTHIHLSVSRQETGYDSDQIWGVANWRLQDPEASQPVPPTPTTPSGIILIQRRLNQRFPELSPLTLTGVLNEQTVERLICFQKRSQLVADGELGAATLKKLLR